MKPLYYILDGKKVVSCESVYEWGDKFKEPRHVADTFLFGKNRWLNVRISTVFIGLDHQYGDGPPLVFETMIFGGKHDHEQWRYSTWKEAEAGHAKALQLAKNTLPLSILIELFRSVKYLFDRLQIALNKKL